MIEETRNKEVCLAISISDMLHKYVRLHVTYLPAFQGRGGVAPLGQRKSDIFAELQLPTFDEQGGLWLAAIKFRYRCR